MSTPIDTAVHMEHEACRRAFLKFFAASSLRLAKRGEGGDYALVMHRKNVEELCLAIGITHIRVGEDIFDAILRLSEEI